MKSAEAAKILGISRSGLYHHIKMGRLHPFKPDKGCYNLFDENEVYALKELIEANKPGYIKDCRNV